MEGGIWPLRMYYNRKSVRRRKGIRKEGRMSEDERAPEKRGRMSEGERAPEKGEDVGRRKGIKKRNTFWPPTASLYGFGGKGGITGESVLIIFNQYALSNFLIQWTIPLFL